MCIFGLLWLPVFHISLIPDFLIAVVISVVGILLLAFSLLALLLVDDATLVDQVLLISEEILVFIKRMLSQISHIDVNLGLVRPHIIINLAQEQLKSLYKVTMVLPDVRLMVCKLLLHVQDQLLEELLVVQNQLGNDSFVNLSGRELILRVFDDHSCQFGEVFGDFWRAFLHDK